MRFHLIGSIAEREHLKWKNAIDLPNNPYSAEALQKRISQSNLNKSVDVERLASKTNSIAQVEQPSMPPDVPIRVVLGSTKPDAVR